MGLARAMDAAPYTSERVADQNRDTDPVGDSAAGPPEGWKAAPVCIPDACLRVCGPWRHRRIHADPPTTPFLLVAGWAAVKG